MMTYETPDYHLLQSWAVQFPHSSEEARVLVMWGAICWADNERMLQVHDHRHATRAQRETLWNSYLYLARRKDRIKCAAEPVHRTPLSLYELKKGEGEGNKYVQELAKN